MCMKTLIYLFIFILLLSLYGCGEIHNPTTAMPYELGSVEIDPNEVANYPQSLPVSVKLPESASMVEYLPEIGNQGALGSCTAWAFGYCSRTSINKKQWNVDLANPINIASPAFLYKMSLIESNKPWGSGLNPKIVHDVLVKYGTNSIKESPYSDTAGDSFNVNQIDNNVFRTDSYETVNFMSRENIKTEIVLGRPVDISLSLYTDFPDYKGDYVYKGNGEWWTTGLFTYSRHALVIVGYDNTRQAYRIANSWSTYWGDNGYMWLDYSTFEKMCNIAFVQHIYQAEYPQPQALVYPSLEGSMKEFYQYKTSKGWSVLYINIALNQPSNVESIRLTLPQGTIASQNYNAYFRQGVFYFYIDNGGEFPGGDYSITVKTSDKDITLRSTLTNIKKDLTAQEIQSIKGMNRKTIY